MQIITDFPSLIDRWLRYKFQTVLVVCFLLWTPLLVIETLQIQHSCHPMIHWSGTLPAECQSKKPETRRDRSQEQKQIAQSDTSPSPKPSPTPKSDESPPPPEKPHGVEDAIKTAKEHPDIITSILTVVAGIGVAVWFVISRASAS